MKSQPNLSISCTAILLLSFLSTCTTIALAGQEGTWIGTWDDGPLRDTAFTWTLDNDGKMTGKWQESLFRFGLSGIVTVNVEGTHKYNMFLREVAIHATGTEYSGGYRVEIELIASGRFATDTTSGASTVRYTVYYGTRPLRNIVDEDPWTADRVVEIAVTSPNGGEFLAPESAHEITWTTNVSASSDVKIELFNDGVFNRIIASSTPNDGSYDWNVPVAAAWLSQCTIKITYLTNTAYFDVSDSIFAILGQEVTLVLPNGGEMLEGGKYYGITWDGCSAASDMAIELYRGNTFASLISANTPNDGYYWWPIPADTLDADNYRIRIITSGGMPCVDWSDGYFTITSPYLFLISPNGGQVWDRGTTHGIAWQSYGDVGSYVRIDLVRSGSVVETVTSRTDNDGLYYWIIADHLSGTDCKIKISDWQEPLIYDQSLSEFTISPAIKVTYPNTSMIWRQITTERITWDSYGNVGQDVRIDLYKAGLFETTIVDYTPNDSSYDWQVECPLEEASDYTVRIESADNPSIFDFGDSNFTIKTPIVITYPYSGAKWAKGSTYTIRWNPTDTGIDKVNISLKGPSNNSIAYYTDNDGSYAWTIDQCLRPGNYRVEIDVSGNNCLKGYSDTFSLTGDDPVINITSPQDQDTWIVGSTQNITWNSSGVPGDSVSLYIGGYYGGPAGRFITQDTSDDGLFTWTIPEGVTSYDRYRLTVRSIECYLISDTNQGHFSILGHITVNSPSGSAAWQTGNTYNITWDSTDPPEAHVNIVLFKGGELLTQIASSSLNDGLYSWTLPNWLQTDTDYQVHIESEEFPEVSDLSNAYFTINSSASPLTVISPNGGEQINRGTRYEINWSIGGAGPDVKIELHAGGSYRSTIAESVPNNGTHLWFIASNHQIRDDFRIKISSVSNPSVSDFSNGYISILSGLVLTSPLGGETWYRGQAYNVTWGSGDFGVGDSIMIYLYKGSVQNDYLALTSNDGSYSWSIPVTQVVGDDYEIRIGDGLVGGGNSDQSEHFTISGDLVVNSPNGGETWQSETSQEITWQSSGLVGPNVKIELYRDDAYYQTIADSALNSGSYNWNIPPAYFGDDFTVKISSTDNPSLTGFSDSTFAISRDGSVHLVDHLATGANNGSTWPNAFNNLQDAIAVALCGDKIYVAAGTYKPDQGQGITSGDRNARFELTTCLKIYGGFPSGGGKWNSRNPHLHKTILSGDLAGNDNISLATQDLLSDATRSENSFTVILVNSGSVELVIDGFTITAGNANNNASSSYTQTGGAMDIYSSNPNITNCLFIANSATNSGGAIYNTKGNPILAGCIFTGNYAGYAGGAIANTGTNSLDIAPELLHCTFVSNQAASGGVMYTRWCNPIFSGCILWNNSASQRGNQITFWDYTDATISHCNIQGGQADIYAGLSTSVTWDSTNIDADPAFVDPDGPDDITGTPDDNVSLTPSSPCIDKADNNMVPADLTADPAGNVRIIDGDCDGTATVDMGAFEFDFTNFGDFDNQCDTDMADFAVFSDAWLTGVGNISWNPVCDISIPPDGTIDTYDLAIFAQYWLSATTP